MNNLLEAKVIISKIKTRVLDLTSELVTDETADNQVAIDRLLTIVEYIEKEDVSTDYIRETL